jgi:hypothetical protein
MTNEQLITTLEAEKAALVAEVERLRSDNAALVEGIRTAAICLRQSAEWATQDEMEMWADDARALLERTAHD